MNSQASQEMDFGGDTQGSQYGYSQQDFTLSSQTTHQTEFSQQSKFIDDDQDESDDDEEFVGDAVDENELPAHACV